MITRSVVRYSNTRGRQVFRAQLFRVNHCRYSTSTQTPVSHGTSLAPGLGVFTNELDRIAPKFEIAGSQVRILRTPAEFYETLKVGNRTLVTDVADKGRPKYSMQKERSFCLHCT